MATQHCDVSGAAEKISARKYVVLLARQCLAAVEEGRIKTYDVLACMNTLSCTR